nr:hypothetical protein [Propionicimonas sp.]
MGGTGHAQPTALEIVDTRMGRLLDVIGHAYRQPGLDADAGGDRVFEQLVTARIIEATRRRTPPG